jgi:hypothetical protein
MQRSRIFVALFAVVAICLSAAPPTGAQSGTASVREKAAPVPAARPAAAPPPQVRSDSTHASKSVSQRLFDAGWVIFPARVAIVIVFMSVGLLLAMGGSWSALRVAHSLWHTEWGEPPRRLKRGEVGAAGTTLAVEWEERLSSNANKDREQDRQIALLKEAFKRMNEEFAAHDTRLANLEALAGARHERTGDVG